MFNKPFDEITKADIDRLVTDGIPEGRTLDYKAELPKSSDGEKKEFARDVTSFANAAGGYIVYGVTEQKDAAGKNTGVAGAADGLLGVNADTEILRMESMLRGNIDPIVPGLRFKKIEGFTNGPVILLHIPKSWAAPHMVAVDNDSRFYSRGSAGKQSMDVREIRSAFVLSAEMPALIRRFRDERLGRIMADETPMALMGRARVVLHMIPFSSMGIDTGGIDLAAIDADAPAPLRTGSGWNNRYNFDGWLSFSGPDRGAQRSYLQVFRSGALETVMAYTHGPSSGVTLFYNPWGIEEDVLDALRRYVQLYKKHQVEPPVVIALSLLNFRNATIPPNPESPGDDVYSVDRDMLLLPDVLVRDYGDALHTLMRPAFDALWQAAGVPKSFSYDENGKWGKNGYKRMRF
ncbi:MAG: ATP-binding protein [Polyangiaceae bacterium]|nr:ATP-binding protein [Polyangiaceae bacterium]